MIQLTFTFLFTGLVSHRHDNTNERTKPVPKWKDDDIKATAVLSEVDGEEDELPLDWDAI
jgi:hypothetical protein